MSRLLSILQHQFTRHPHVFWEAAIMDNLCPMTKVSHVQKMSCGLPRIISASGAIPYVVRDKDTASLVNPRAIAEPRNVIQNLILNKEVCIRIGVKVWEYVKKYYDLDLVEMDRLNGVDAVVMAVIHDAYRELGLKGMSRLCPNGDPIVIDVKSAFSPREASEAGITYWRL